MTTISAKTPLKLLCDGCASPNPGSMYRIVFNGSSYLPLKPVLAGTNHQSVYEAVLAGLHYALSRNCAEVEISLLSTLVYTQITTAGYCRNPDLISYRKEVYALAKGRMGVTWKHLKPPVRILSRSTAVRAFRRRALREIAEALRDG